MDNLRESIIKWLNSQKRDFNTGLALFKKSGCKPHVLTHIKSKGATDPHAHRVLNIELRNCLREIHKEARNAEKEAKSKDQPQDTEDTFVGNIEKELQKEYPGIIKKALTEFPDFDNASP
jgi:hypothetical protein